MKSLSKLLGYETTLILSANHYAQGAIESRIKQTKYFLVKFASKTPDQWDDYLDLACYVANTQIHPSFIELTPYEIYFGRPPLQFNHIQLPEPLRELQQDSDFPLISYLKYRELHESHNDSFKDYYAGLKKKIQQGNKKGS